MKRVLIGVSGLAVVAVAVAMFFEGMLAPVDRHAQAVDFELTAGASLGTVARDLEEAALVKSARATVLWGRLSGLDSKLRAGEYELSAALSTREILARFTEGRVKTHSVSIPEGFRATDVADRLAGAGLVDREDFLEIVRDPTSPERHDVEGTTLEGYLFPETYQIARGLPAEEVVRVLVEHFLEVWREIEPKAKDQGFGMQEVVTLASIVEKETAEADERPLIAAVFRNRLEKGMKLETDPTVIYGIRDFDGNLRRSHLEDASNPYNTYMIPALPPGPIANPGAEALRAVVNPAETDYLFFVSRNDGTHEFSETYREHVNAVNRYQRRARR